MANVIVSKRHSVRKDNSNHSGASGLLLLGAKLSSIKAITKATVNNAQMTDIDIFDVMSGVDDLLQTVCELCDGLDLQQIAADIRAEAAEPNTAE